MYKSTNRFYIKDKSLLAKLQTLTSHEHYKNRELTCQEYPDAIIQPFLCKDGKFGGGVLDSNNNYVYNTGYHEFIHESYPYRENEVDIRRERVLYIGCIYQCWGHLFTDCFAKLWYLETNNYKQLQQEGIKVVYITKDNKPLPQYVFDLFDIAGFDLRPFEHITSHVRFDSVLVPDNSFYLQKEPYERMFTDEYLSLLARIRSNFADREGDYPEKIYLTRTKLCQDQRDYGEIEIEKYMERLGYTIIAPEQHSVEEQINLMVHCKSVVATEGSVSLTSVFCQPGTSLTVLKKGNYTNGYQAAVADAAMLSVTYVEANKSIFNNKITPWVGPFFIYPNKLFRSAVETDLGERCLIFNKEWIRYINDYNPLSRRIFK